MADINPFAFTDDDLDKTVRTVWGEARGEQPDGWKAVAGVIKNRARLGKQSPSQVVLAPYQFEPWQSKRGELEGLDPNSPDYLKIKAAIKPIFEGTEPDPTGGATHFYSPKVQSALGRKPPSWDDGSGVDLGTHRFFRLGYSPRSGVPGTANSPPAGLLSGYPTPSLPPASRPMAYDDDDFGGYTPPDLIKARLARLRQSREAANITPLSPGAGLFSGLTGAIRDYQMMGAEKDILKNQKSVAADLRELARIDQEIDRGPPVPVVGPAGPGAPPKPAPAPTSVAAAPPLPAGMDPATAAPSPAPSPITTGAVPPAPAGAPPAGPTGYATAPPIGAGPRPANAVSPDVFRTEREFARDQILNRLAEKGYQPAIRALEAKETMKLNASMKRQERREAKEDALAEKVLAAKTQLFHALNAGTIGEVEFMRGLANIDRMYGTVTAPTGATPAGGPAPAPGPSPSGPARDARGIIVDPNHPNFLLDAEAVKLKKAGDYYASIGDHKTAESIGKSLERNASYQRQKGGTDDRGKAIALAQSKLPEVVASTDRLFGYIDDILYQKDPRTGRPARDAENNLIPNKKLDDAVGKYVGSQHIPDLMRSQDVIDMHAKIEQITGAAFLQALQAMKGAGTVTDIEGAKGAAARLRAKLIQSPGAFREALEDFRREVMDMRKVTEDTAAGKLVLGTPLPPSADEKAPPVRAEGEPAERPAELAKHPGAQWRNNWKDGITGYAIPKPGGGFARYRWPIDQPGKPPAEPSATPPPASSPPAAPAPSTPEPPSGPAFGPGIRQGLGLLNPATAIGELIGRQVGGMLPGRGAPTPTPAPGVNASPAPAPAPTPQVPPAAINKPAPSPVTAPPANAPGKTPQNPHSGETPLSKVAVGDYWRAGPRMLLRRKRIQTNDIDDFEAVPPPAQ